MTVFMQVLVNNRTASASEIVSCPNLLLPMMIKISCLKCVGAMKQLVLQVATALHDNCKAVLVGERTFGKV